MPISFVYCHTPSCAAKCYGCYPVYLTKCEHNISRNWGTVSLSRRLISGFTVPTAHLFLEVFAAANVLYVVTFLNMPEDNSFCVLFGDVAHLDAFDQWCLWHLLGITYQHRGLRMHWSACCQRDHISVKTICARPYVENATDAYKAIYQDIPSDPVDLHSPGWPPYTVETGYWPGNVRELAADHLEGVGSWRYAPLWCMLLIFKFNLFTYLFFMYFGKGNRLFSVMETWRDPWTQHCKQTS